MLPQSSGMLSNWPIGNKPTKFVLQRDSSNQDGQRNFRYQNNRTRNEHILEHITYHGNWDLRGLCYKYIQNDCGNHSGSEPDYIRDLYRDGLRDCDGDIYQHHGNTYNRKLFRSRLIE